jgi:hypothetical protein
MWRQGRKMFSVACILILLTAAAHTAGNLIAGSSGAAEDKVMGAMHEYHQNMGLGMEPSMYDILRALTFTMSITFAALGILGLMLAANKSVSRVVIRNVAWFYLIWNGAFTIMSYCYRVPPPLISGALVEITLIAALLPSAAKADEAMVAKAGR